MCSLTRMCSLTTTEAKQSSICCYYCCMGIIAIMVQCFLQKKNGIASAGRNKRRFPTNNASKTLSNKQQRFSGSNKQQSFSGETNKRRFPTNKKKLRTRSQSSICLLSCCYLYYSSSSYKERRLVQLTTTLVSCCYCHADHLSTGKKTPVNKKI